MTYEIITPRPAFGVFPAWRRVVDVMIDNTVIQSNSLAAQLRGLHSSSWPRRNPHTVFCGQDLAGGDNTVFLDDVQVHHRPPVIPNYSF